MRLATLLYFMLGCTYLVSAQLEVLTDSPFARYEAGQAANFEVTSPQSGQITWEVRRSLRTPIIASGTVTHNGGTTVIPYTLPEPGFVTFAARLNGMYDAVGATFSQHALDALADEPADFDAFWNNQKAQLAAVPLDVQTWVQTRNAYSTTYAFNLAQVDGRRVYGYVVIPDGDGPFPATLRLPAFGRGPNLTTPDVQGAERYNAIAFSVNIHNVPPNQEAWDAYTPNVILEPETFYYRWAILGAIRAIDYLETLPNWNQRDLMIYGDSQGGGLSMLVAGIDGRPTALLASTAALSQHAGLRFDRPSGFPYFLELANALYAPNQSQLDQAFEATKYYETIFAARRFNGVSQHYVGLLDDICPPATSYAAHNAMPGPKAMLHALDNGHRPPREFIEERGQFMRQHFPDSRTPPFDFGDTERGYYIDAGPDRQIVTDSVINLAPTFGYDQRGDAASDWSARWRVLEAPGPATFGNTTDAFSNVSFADSGRYVLELELTDPYPEQPRKYWTLTDRLTIDVTPRSDTMTVDTSGTDTTGGMNIVRRTLLREVAVAPTPTASWVQVSGRLVSPQALRLRLLDALGREVWQRPVRGGRVSAINERIDLTTQPSGSYQLLLEGTDGVQRIPLVRQ